MPLSSNIVRLEVIINRNGHPKKVLKDVRSVIEISDEENETISALSFCETQPDGTSKWVDIAAGKFDRITIEPRRNTRD